MGEEFLPRERPPTAEWAQTYFRLPEEGGPLPGRYDLTYTPYLWGIFAAKQAMERRRVYSESLLWETETARAWLCRMVFAVIFEFGLKEGVGTERMSSFFHRIHLDREIGVSPSALLRLMNRMKEGVAEYGRLQETGQERTTGELKDIIAGADETFYANLILLVVMELGSGYLLLEEEAPDRSFETWHGKLDKRLEQMGFRVRHLVSDRAKALIKLAVDGLGCRSGADLFHAQQEITRWLGIGFRGKLGKIQKAVLRVQTELQAQGTHVLNTTRQTLALVKAEQNRLEKSKEEYLDLLRGISKVLHPFCLTGTKQDTPQVVREVKARAQMLAALGQEYSLPDKKGWCLTLT
ncbi:hypothetical protein CCP3SC15_1740007 [Gammaproteobacteria bacterium]